MATSYIGRSDLPRGLRNNNPGNITTGDAWQGMIGADGRFVVFENLTWGYRALATDLVNKIQVDGLDTITKIVKDYAPASDNNNVPAYIAAVVNYTGIPADQVLTLDLPTIHNLVGAIATHEIGDAYSNYIADSDIDEGIQLMNNRLLSLLQAGAVAVAETVKNTTPTTWIGIAAGAVILYLIFAKN